MRFVKQNQLWAMRKLGEATDIPHILNSRYQFIKQSVYHHNRPTLVGNLSYLQTYSMVEHGILCWYGNSPVLII